AAVKLIPCWPKAATAAKGRIASIRNAALSLVLKLFFRMVFLTLGFSHPRRHIDSSITNSRESTSNIINMPPGKTLLVVISRSLCECHINAQPRSFEGLACVLDGSSVVQYALGVPAQAGAVARRLASGPK